MQKPIVINGRQILPGESGEINLSGHRLPTRTIIEIPVHVYRSKNDGPVVLFMAGVHGDEINGIEIIRKLMRDRCFDHLLCGSVITIPIINIVSFLAGTRELPDGRDLNRCFPGSTAGSLGSRIAYEMMHEILPQIDFGFDFHTGGAKINNYPQLRCVLDDPKNLELSTLFGAPFILNSPCRDKTFRKQAALKGKSILVYEGGESLRFNTLAITEGINGCLRIMNNLKMIKTDVPPSKSIILQDTRWLRAKISGLFRTTKKYGSFIEKNEVVGTISDPNAEMEVQLKSPANGYIIGINNQPVINEGDALIHMGIEK